MVSVRKNRFQKGKRKTGKVNKFTTSKDGLIKRFDLILPESIINGNLDRLNRPPWLWVPFECQVDNEVQEN